MDMKNSTRKYSSFWALGLFVMSSSFYIVSTHGSMSAMMLPAVECEKIAVDKCPLETDNGCWIRGKNPAIGKCDTKEVTVTVKGKDGKPKQVTTVVCYCNPDLIKNPDPTPSPTPMLHY